MEYFKRHGLRNIMLPAITMQFGSLVSFSVLFWRKQCSLIRDLVRRHLRQVWARIFPYCWELRCLAPYLFL